MRFYTVEKLGPNREKTPEGFLLCIGVPIARTGMMIYGPDETPVSGGPDGVTKIFRDAEQVFRDETIASAQGKPITNDHPDDDVVPATWKKLSIGTMMNVRRGAGNEDDLLQADFLVMDAGGIALIESGKAEVSLGYDADYVEVEPGIGRQENIYINHIAVVDEGRCGPRCAVRDHKPNLEATMTTPVKTAKIATKQSVRDSLLKFFTQAFKAKDAAEVEKLVEDAAAEMEEEGASATGDTHVHVHTGDDDFEEFKKTNDAEHAEMRERITALEGTIAGKAKDTGEGNPDPNKNTQGKQGSDPTTLDGKGKDETPEDKEKREKEEAASKAADAARDEETRADEMALDELPEDLKEEAKRNKDKVKDSAFLGDTVREVASMAEILSPGISLPTFDAADRPGITAKRLCMFRRKSLDAAYTHTDTRDIIDTLMAGRKFDTAAMTCDAARTLFRSASALKLKLNNAKTATRGIMDGKHSSDAAPVVTLADINAKNAAHWAGKK
jgi:hypothetical protein